MLILYAADPAVAEAPHRGIDRIAFAKYPPGSFEQLAPWHRGVCLLAQTLDQSEAEPPLQLADLQTDCRLRQVKPARGGGKAAVLDHSTRVRNWSRLRLRTQNFPYQPCVVK